MAADPQLIKDWIQYLKNNRIVAMQSDPKTGQLKYNRPATIQDLEAFLDGTGQFDEKAIQKAIAAISGGPTQQEPIPPKNLDNRKITMRSKGAKVFRNIGKQLTESEQISFKKIYEDISDLGSVGAKRAAAHQTQDIAKNYGSSLKGGDYSDKIKKQPEQPEKPQPEKPQQTPNAEGNKGLHEKDVEKVFAMLGAMKNSPQEKPASSEPKQNPEKDQATRNKEMNQLRMMIRDTMTPQQRKSLYRALSDTELSEALVNKADVKYIFQTAADEKNNSIKSRLLRKDKISANDLQQVWKEEGFPDDTRDIVRILKDQGFSEHEIKWAMTKTFGPRKDDETGEPVASPAIQKIADIAKERGYAEELKKFMEREFRDELEIPPEWSKNLGRATGGLVRGLTGKTTTEDVRQIFEYIVLEERTERLKLIREQEQTNLGRNRKISIVEQDLDVGQVLKSNQVVDLLKSLKLKVDPKIDVSSVGSQIIQSWKKGLTSRKHYDNLLNTVNLSIKDLID